MKTKLTFLIAFLGIVCSVRAQWISMEFPANAAKTRELEQVAARDSLVFGTGIRGGAHAQYFRSTDGGISWDYYLQEKYLNDRVSLPLDIAFPAHDFLITGHDSGWVRISRDFGDSWDTVKIAEGMSISEVIMTDTNYAVMLAESEEFGVFPNAFADVYYTTDGFENIHELKLPDLLEERPLNALFANNNIIGFYGYIDPYSPEIELFTTTDLGETWRSHPKIADSDGIYANSDGEIFTLGMLPADTLDNGRIQYYPSVLRSRDRGRSYDTLYICEEIYHNKSNEPAHYKIYESGRGFIVAYGKSKFITHDRGDSWSRISIEDYYGHFRDVAFVNEKKYIVAKDYWMLIYDENLISVPDEAINNTKISPNPASDAARVEFTLGEGGLVRIGLTDALGREVIPTTEKYYPAGGNAAQLDLSGLAPGVYYLRVTHSGATQTRQVVVVR
jgi:photosystem II stability/assembly factor-like uncharacterized protein